MAFGEPIPPHFQFPSKAKIEDNFGIKLNAMKYMKSVRAQFGNSLEREWGCTIGVNSKGGMDEAEFKKYIKINIVRLYPDAAEHC